MKYLLLIAMTLMGAFGAYFLKRASGADGLMKLLRTPAFYLGGGLYGLSAILNILLLRILPYSVVLPLTSLTYIWTAIIGWKLLNEKITRRMVTGIACIIAGVLLLVTAH